MGPPRDVEKGRSAELNLNNGQKSLLLNPRPMGEVGHESASDLEWDLAQRASSRATQEFFFCLSLVVFRSGEEQGAEFHNRAQRAG